MFTLRGFSAASLYCNFKNDEAEIYINILGQSNKVTILFKTMTNTMPIFNLPLKLHKKNYINKVLQSPKFSEIYGCFQK